jgi:hypothetical protein
MSNLLVGKKVKESNSACRLGDARPVTIAESTNNLDRLEKLDLALA